MGEVTSAFENKTVFVTGATGFLGQPLVEKILLSIPSVRRIYVLIRDKCQMGGKTISAEERLKRELFKSSVFDRLRSMKGGEFEVFLEERVVVVPGDITLDRFGLEAEDLERLHQEVDIVINSAALVSFDAPLDAALEMNVRSAARVAVFAKDCKCAALVHISTAYVSGATRAAVAETLYHKTCDPANPHPMRQFTDIDKEIRYLEVIIARTREEGFSPEVDRQLKEALLKASRSPRGGRKTRRREKIENLREKWIKTHLIERGMLWARQRGWNDTYTYTKALGEQVIVDGCGEIPTAIIRPSVIESSLSEPSPGWLDGLRMADPLIVAIGKGRLRALPMDPSVTLDLIPVDMVVNAVLASAQEIIRRKGIHVYQVATGDKNPTTLGELYELVYEYFKKNPMLDRAGQPILVKPMRFPGPTVFRLQHKLKTLPLGAAGWVLNQLPPSGPSDRAKRKILAAKTAYERLYYYGKIYRPYLNLGTRFKADKTLRLFRSLSKEEQQTFSFDITQLNWRHYIQNVHIPGVKKYILKTEGTGALEVEDDAVADITINQLLGRTASRCPQKTALQIKRNNQWHRYTYREFYAATQRIGRTFLELGLRKGDRVVLYSENQPEWAIAFLAATAAGLVVVPLDPQTWHKEVWATTAFTEARALLVSERCFDRLEVEGFTTTETLPMLLNINNNCGLFAGGKVPGTTHAQQARQGVPLPATMPGDAVSIIFTTGTTVDPKGATHTHRSFISNLLGVNHYLPITPSEQMLSVLPLYHALEFTCGLLLPIYGGGTVTYTQTLKPKAILETMRETGTTCMLGVPTLFALIRDDVERRVLQKSKSALKLKWVSTSKQISRSVERAFGKSIGHKLFARVHEEFGGQIRFFVSGGSALGEQLYEDFRVFGMPIYEGYGLTESAPVLTANPLGRSRKGSAGKPLPGVELGIFRPDRNGVGEIIARTPSLMRGYYKNAAATKKAVRHGWLHTGDAGWVDADGYVYITGRFKDVIVTGAGKNVYPVDLEAIYQGVEGVEEICVLGIKNGLTEDVHGVVSVGDAGLAGASISSVGKQIQKSIQQLARALPGYQRLQHIHMQREPLPRGPDGLVSRKRVRRRLMEDLSAPPGLTLARGRPERHDEQSLFQELGRLSGVSAAEICPASNLYSDLGLDSLKGIELLLFVEHTYAISIPDETARALETAGQVWDEIRKQSGKAHPTGATLRCPPASPSKERSGFSRLLQGLTCVALRVFYRMYFRLHLVNEERLPRQGAYVIAANHASHLDTGAVIAALSQAMGTRQALRLHVMAARDYFFAKWWKGWLFSLLLNVIPVEREEVSLGGLRRVKAILSAGHPVLIYPEGTRSRSGRIQEFKAGLGLISLQLEVPIIPVHIDGTHAALPPGAAIPRPAPLKITVGHPVGMQGYRVGAETSPSDVVYRQIATDVRQAIVSLAEKK